MPNVCPACNADVVKSEDEAVHRCIGSNCPAQLKESLFHFTSRNAMDVDGLGKKLVNQLVENELVKVPSDIYDLTIEMLMPMERMAERSAQNLVDSIEKSKHTTFARLIYALGIRYVGEHIAQILAEEFSDIHSLMDASEEHANFNCWNNNIFLKFKF